MKRISEDLYKIDNVFPELICKKILKLFEIEKKWKFISQAREKHYRHVFSPQKNLDKKLFPSKREIYFAKFYRSDNLKKNLFLNNQIKKYVLPYLEKIKIKYSNYEIRCHKFKKGNFLPVLLTLSVYKRYIFSILFDKFNFINGRLIVEFITLKIISIGNTDFL